MVTEPRFQLTTKDHAILQTLLERYRGPRGPYLLLLERKVRDSAITFRDDIAPDVVTLNTRLTYLVDGARAGPHLLVQSQGQDLPPFALSIHTLRGLALLGMAQGGSIDVEPGPDIRETLVVESIVSQPEADARTSAAPAGSVRAFGGGSDTVVAFRRRPSSAAARADFHPDDDDPGPRAA